MTPGLITTKRLAAPRAYAGAGQQYIVPATVDLRAQLLASSNQGQTSQCVAYALAGWLEFYRWKHFGITAQINPGPIYARAKQLDGFPSVEGTTLEAGVRAAEELGLIRVLDIRSITHPTEVQRALHQYGCVLAGFNIDDGWLDAQPGGWIPPGRNPLGGHAVLLCGYNLAEDWFAFQNSWGEQQGWRGFNRMRGAQFAQQFDYGLVWEVTW